MDSDDRVLAFIWTTVCASLLGAVFMISSCVQKTEILNQQTQFACMKAKGQWMAVPDTNGTMRCYIRK